MEINWDFVPSPFTKKDAEEMFVEVRKKLIDDYKHPGPQCFSGTNVKLEEPVENLIEALLERKRVNELALKLFEKTA